MLSVVITNTGGSVTSSDVKLTVVSATSPTIADQPVNRRVRLGQTAKFSVTASWSAPLACQWRKNGTETSGATVASYRAPGATAADNGAVFSWCSVTVSAA